MKDISMKDISMKDIRMKDISMKDISMKDISMKDTERQTISSSPEQVRRGTGAELSRARTVVLGSGRGSISSRSATT